MRDRDEQDIQKKMGEGMSDSGRNRESQRGTQPNDRDDDMGRGGSTKRDEPTKHDTNR